MERTAPWVERVGISYIQEQIMEDEAHRQALIERFKTSQRIAQVDPWAERAKGVQAHEFAPLKIIA